MKSPTHPMDEALTRRGWKRARLDDLSGESAKLAARVMFRSFNLDPGTRPLMVVIDVNLWLQDNNLVRMETPHPNVPQFLEILVAQGLLGVTPHGVGLVPCMHEPWHWNPFSLPLIWQQEMDSMPHFNGFARRYMRALQDTSWQCPDAARLMHWGN